MQHKQANDWLGSGRGLSTDSSWIRTPNYFIQAPFIGIKGMKQMGAWKVTNNLFSFRNLRNGRVEFEDGWLVKPSFIT
jgi:hypothetical protein